VKNIDTAKIDQDTWNRYLMVGFVSTTILWNALSNQALRQSYNTLRSELVQPSASTQHLLEGITTHRACNHEEIAKKK
jgi:hypothetical protein